MADASTIARPYAKAVFELALNEGKLEQWGELLAGLAEAMSQPAMEHLLNDPTHGGEKLAGVIVDALGEHVDQSGKNFIGLLAEYDRLGVVTEIAERYEALRAEAERTVDVEVTSAAPLSDEHKQKLAASLQTRLGRDVRLHCEVDETLIGGAVIRAGDLVIDGSLRARLNQLAATFNA